MADLNLDQITEKLNQEFETDTRKLVFWYDDNGDFLDDIDSIKLKNAKVYRLTPTNQFRTKILLERQDRTTNYLLYAPFPKPPVEQNHLEDTLLYSRRFYADRASLIMADLGIPERYQPVIRKYIRFFGEKKRTQRFYDLEIENFTQETIDNQIDARGESLQTEDEVFQAYEEAIEEVAALIHHFVSKGNTYRFIVTADHGFLYKREPLKESDKISSRAEKNAFLDRRFVVSQTAIAEDGVASITMGTILGNEDTKQVSFPVSTNVFKAGGGMNYVHGGSSPQEMILPILDIKMERYHVETRTVQINLLSIVRKITNLVTSLDFSFCYIESLRPDSLQFCCSEDYQKKEKQNGGRSSISG